MAALPTVWLDDASPADLAWLTGNWAGLAGTASVEEYWAPLLANTLLGMFRWVENGAVRFYELEAIEQQGAHVFMRVKHFDPGLVGWEERDRAYELALVDVQDDGAIFLETGRPDPRWVVYRREGKDRLTIHFTRTGEPEPDPGVFELVRQVWR